ncbi:MAG TPA: hypothetical protein VHY08_02555 [Bacillota bacterium]|nr:hypothetical protein [Bacillota bacterium]
MNWSRTRKLIQIIFGLGLVFLSLLTIPQVSIAGENPVPDPRDSWIYKGLELMANEGLISNYPVEWVKSGHMLSRLEIAYYLKQSVVHQLEIRMNRNLTKQVIDVLQKLLLEFQTELSALGIQTTDIYRISPDLKETVLPPDGYQDLDLLKLGTAQESTAFYFLGQYFKESERKTFIFLPEIYASENDLSVLEGKIDTLNLVYQPTLENGLTYLIVKGVLPTDTQSLAGYYLFPIENSNLGEIQAGANLLSGDFSQPVLTLLDEVKQLKQLENLWRYNGSLSLEGYRRFETDFRNQIVIGDYNQSLVIGGLLIYSQNSLGSKDGASDNLISNFGLPLYNTFSSSLNPLVDLDSLTEKNLQTLQINIKGAIALSPQTSLSGSLDFLYQGNDIKLDNLWPSDTKASAGVAIQFNDYWTFLTYQSLVNSHLETYWLSTTSFGVEYDDWITLWLAYQFLKFDDPVITGTLSLRF